MGKESFVIYKSFYKPISKLSDKQLGRLFRAIFLYQFGEVVTVEEDIDMAFEFFKNQFEIDESKYQGIVERNRKNGRREGSKDIEEHTNDGKSPVAPSGTKSEPKSPVAPSGEYNDNVNENKKTTTNVVAKKDAAKAATLKRKSEFRQTLAPYVGVYPNDMLRDFCDYWTEMNKSCTKMRFEQQPTWEIARRLATWAKNDKQYENNRGSYASKQEANEYAMQQYIADRERDGLDDEVEKPF